MKVPLASTGLRDKDISAATEVMNSGMLTMGARVKEFEKKMAEYLGVKHFVMVNSGSSANLAIVEGLLRPAKQHPYLRAGDKVLVPAIAWPTTIWPLIQLGLTPVFVDVDPQTLAINLDSAQAKLEKDNTIKGIFPIHILGLGIDENKLLPFVKDHNLVLINDMCESLGSKQSNFHTGIRGVAASFSFYFSHHITTMEGGGIATNSTDFADDLRSIRSHGWTRDRTDFNHWANNLSFNDSRFLFISTGYNIRPMEIQAAIGLKQLEDIDYFISRRRSNAMRVNESLKNNALELIGAFTFLNGEWERHSWMMLPIRVLGSDAVTKKRETVNRLNQMGIETRPVLTGNFLSQPAMKRFNFGTRSDFPIATEIEETCFLIGNHHDFSDEQIDLVIDALNFK